MSQQIPADAPPSYADATGSSSSSRPTGSSSHHSDNSRLQVPGVSSSGKKDAIPSSYRRSMEDEQRPLPSGWVRTYDPSTEHQFYVDTSKDPPRSIWVHPYDDDDYLATLSTEERERIEQESMHRGRQPSHDDIVAAHPDDDDDGASHNDTHRAGASSSSAQTSTNIPSELPPRESKGKGKGADSRTFGRKFKDKVTGMTHEERVAERKRRSAEEQRAYEAHIRVRQAMSEAMRTGRPVLVGKDRDGKDVFVEPPTQQSYYGGGGFGPYGGGGYGYNPYSNNGVYSTPNARYIRPQAPYGRPYGGGFGGGYGLPLALGGGLLGGLLLGDVLAGGF